MKSLFIISVLLFTVFQAVQTLDASEEAALREILDHHPDLYSVPSWESFSDGIYYGSSWNDSISMICQREGYEFFGVYCSSGHVSALRMYVESF